MPNMEFVAHVQINIFRISNICCELCIPTVQARSLDTPKKFNFFQDVSIHRKYSLRIESLFKLGPINILEPQD